MSPIPLRKLTDSLICKVIGILVRILVNSKKIATYTKKFFFLRKYFRSWWNSSKRWEKPKAKNTIINTWVDEIGFFLFPRLNLVNLLRIPILFPRWNITWNLNSKLHHFKTKLNLIPGRRNSLCSKPKSSWAYKNIYMQQLF